MPGDTPVHRGEASFQIRLNDKKKTNDMEKGFDALAHDARIGEIQSKITEHVQAIFDLEKELDTLRTDDIFEVVDYATPIPTQNLWRNLSRIEKRPSGYAQSRSRFDEDPCYAVLDLVVEKLLHTPISSLQLRGCSIHSRGTSVRFCISGEVDGNDFVRTHG